MKTLDKKQIPQFAALCVLSAGLFGYFVMKVVTPGTAAAGTLSAPGTAAATKPSTTKPDAAKMAGTPGAAADSKPGSDANSHSDAAPAPETTDAPPPSPGMRDPFAVGYVDPKTVTPQTATPVVPQMPTLGKQIASIKEIGAKGIEPAPISFPGAPALPTSLSGFPLHSGPSAPGLPTGPAAPPLPLAPPAWTVTGVLQSATERIAVLRNGDARRIVHFGDFVDSTYRVVGVSRTSVVLRHGAALYRLPLGGPKDASGKPAAAPSALATPAALTAPAALTTTLPTTPITPAAAPDTAPASLSGLAGQLEQALPPSPTTEAQHG